METFYDNGQEKLHTRMRNDSEDENIYIGGPKPPEAWNDDDTKKPDPEPPITPKDIVNTTISTDIKSATPQYVLTSEDQIPIEVMADLIFEDIGGQELISLSRSDIINGINISYQPIKNLQYIQQQFNSNNIVALQLTSDRYFANFAIKLNDKLDVSSSNNIYRDSNGDLIIELVDLNKDEEVEVEMLTDGIIYVMENV